MPVGSLHHDLVKRHGGAGVDLPTLLVYSLTCARDHLGKGPLLDKTVSRARQTPLRGAGASIVDSMEEHVHARPAKRVCVEIHRGTSSQDMCNIVIVSHSEPLHKQRDLQSLLRQVRLKIADLLQQGGATYPAAMHDERAWQHWRSDQLPARQARRLQVPVKPMDWAVEALWSGALPGSPPRAPVGPRPAPAPGRAVPSPRRHTAQQFQAAAHAEPLADGQAQAAERPEAATHELIEDSQSLGGACEATPSSPGINSAGPGIDPGTRGPLLRCA